MLKNRLIIVATIILAITAIFMSGFRIVMLSGVIGFSLSIIYLIKCSGAFNKLKYFVLFLLFVFLMPYIILEASYLFSEDFHYSVYRIIERTEESINVLSSGDMTAGRYEEIKGVEKLYSMITIFPNGFVMIGRGVVGLFNDAPYFSILITMGVLIGGLFIIFIVLNNVIFSSYALLIDSKNEAISGVLFPLSMFMLVVLLINGRFLYITYESVLYGIFLGMIFDKNISFLRNSMKIN